MDYFQRSYEQISQDISSLTNVKPSGSNPIRKFKFSLVKVDPKRPIFYVYLFLTISILLLLTKPPIVKNTKTKKISIAKIFITSLVLSTPWIVWYYYG